MFLQTTIHENLPEQVATIVIRFSSKKLGANLVANFGSLSKTLAMHE